MSRRNGPVEKLLADAALLHVQTENAEKLITDFMHRIDRAQKALAKRQEQLAKSGQTAAYKQAVAEEAALTAAYRRLEESIGRMNLPGS